MEQAKCSVHVKPRRPDWRLLGLLCLSLCANAFSSEQQGAEGYGYSDRYGELTPTEVFSLVSNLDAIVMHYAQHTAPERMETLPSEIFPVEGYVPDRVFIALKVLSSKLNRLADKHKVPRVKRVVREQTEAIPAEVFLLAGACLDTLANILSVVEPDNHFGNFYNNHTYNQPKTPSDVYAMVDLIDRKLVVLVGESIPQTE